MRAPKTGSGVRFLSGVLHAIGILLVGLSGVCGFSALISVGGVIAPIVFANWPASGSSVGPSLGTAVGAMLAAGLTGGTLLFLAGKLERS